MYKKIELHNGVRIVVEEMPWVHSVAVGVWIKAGSRFENSSNHGVSHFLEHMFFKGTSKRTAKEISTELESVGGFLNAFTSKETTCLYCRVLKDNLNLAVDILSDMFFNSLFTENDLSKEKKVILEEIKMYEDAPDELVHDLFASTIWGDHPLGRPVLGTISSVEGMTREKLVDYYDKHYTGENIVIAVAGNVETKEIVNQLSEKFGRLQGNKASWESLVRPQAHSAINITCKNVEQVHFCLGLPGLALSNPDIYALSILNNVLGGGLSSRLFQEIREDRGLAYSVYSYHTNYMDSGLMSVYAGTSPDNFLEVLKLVLQEIKEIKKHGISMEELVRTKQQIKGNLLLGTESVGNRMSRLGKTELAHGRVITSEEVVEKIESVQLEKVNELALELFRSELFALTSIGPEQEKLNFKMLLEEYI